jgi:hypothetical protein
MRQADVHSVLACMMLVVMEYQRHGSVFGGSRNAPAGQN